jgi:hypothetical protein
MKPSDEDFRTLVIAWVVIVTTILCVLLPYTVNVPTLPSGAYKLAAGQFPGLTRPESHAAGFVPVEPGGLLVRYDFEGDIARMLSVPDISGNQNTAYVKGIFVGSAPGIIGNYSVFLPGTGFIWCPVNPAAGRTNISFSIWFSGGDTGSNLQLAGAVPAEGTRTGWTLGTRVSELFDDDGNSVRARLVTMTPYRLPSSGWNHKALVYNGTHVAEYLNGAQLSVYTASGRPVGGADEVMTIGSWQPFGRNFAGLVDDLRIYDRALSPDEILDLYQKGA